jgi:hypothetical protein
MVVHSVGERDVERVSIPQTRAPAGGLQGGETNVASALGRVLFAQSKLLLTGELASFEQRMQKLLDRGARQTGARLLQLFGKRHLHPGHGQAQVNPLPYPC